VRDLYSNDVETAAALERHNGGFDDRPSREEIEEKPGECPTCEGDGSVLLGMSVFSNLQRPVFCVCPKCFGTGRA
jgi:DnaJ-class molecular chaperone